VAGVELVGVEVAGVELAGVELAGADAVGGKVVGVDVVGVEVVGVDAVRADAVGGKVVRVDVAGGVVVVAGDAAAGGAAPGRSLEVTGVAAPDVPDRGTGASPLPIASAGATEASGGLGAAAGADRSSRVAIATPPTRITAPSAPITSALARRALVRRTGGAGLIGGELGSWPGEACVADGPAGSPGPATSVGPARIAPPLVGPVLGPAVPATSASSAAASASASGNRAAGAVASPRAITPHSSASAGSGGRRSPTNAISPARSMSGGGRRPATASEGDTQRVLIDAGIGGRAGSLLGRHVRGRAGDVAARGHDHAAILARRGARDVVVGPGRVGRVIPIRRARSDRQAEVGDPDATVGAEQQVRRLDVAVDEAAGVGSREAAGGLRVEPDQHAPVGVRAGTTGEGVAGHELGGDEHLAVELADIVHREHVRMADPREGASLAEQARAFRGIGEPVGPHELHGDLAVELRIPGRPDLAHAAGGDPAIELVAADLAGRGCVVQPGRRGSRCEGPEPGDHGGAVLAAVDVGLEPRERVLAERTLDHADELVLVGAPGHADRGHASAASSSGTASSGARSTRDRLRSIRLSAARTTLSSASGVTPSASASWRRVASTSSARACASVRATVARWTE
jgi:hypothetical protein